MTKRRKNALILSIIAALLLGFCAFMIKGICDYLAEVPQITVLEQNAVTTGSTLALEDLAVVERSVETKLYITNADRTEPVVSADEQHITVGDAAGTFTVCIEAVGKYSEHRSKEITITVVQEGDAS